MSPGVQISAGDPYLEGGRTGSWLAHEDVVVDDDGRFEVLLSPTFAEGSWLECPADATKLFVRQVYGEWTDADPGEVHIDRVGHEGDARPEIADDDMAAQLSRVAVDLRSHARVWPQVVEHMVDERPANVIGPARDSRAAGGVPGRRNRPRHLRAQTDEALLVRTWPAGGDYKGSSSSTSGSSRWSTGTARPASPASRPSSAPTGRTSSSSPRTTRAS